MDVAEGASSGRLLLREGMDVGMRLVLVVYLQRISYLLFSRFFVLFCYVGLIYLLICLE